MRYVGRDFPNLDPTNQRDLTLDFVNDAARCDHVASATWTVEVVKGVDASYATRALGATTWRGQLVTQRMGGLLDGVKYKVTALATMRSGEVIGLYSNITGEA